MLYSTGSGCKPDTSPTFLAPSPYLLTYRTMLALAFSFTTTTTITTIKITAIGTEMPTTRGMFTEDAEGLNPFATKALDATENPAKLAEEREFELERVVGPF